jgi:hypothetical protein
MSKQFQNLIRFYTTREVAYLTRVQSSSIREYMSHQGNGTYMGIKPVRAPNGRLLWPIEAVEEALRGK